MTIRSIVSLAICATLAFTSVNAHDVNHQATNMDRDHDHDEQLRVAVGAHSHLNDATALANKNTVMHGNNVDITRSNVLAQQNDRVMIETEAEQMMEDPASDAVMPSGMSLTGERDPLARPLTSGEEPKDDKDQVQNKEKEKAEAEADTDEDQTDTVDLADQDQSREQLVLRRRFLSYRYRFFYPGFRGGYYGWRYPLPYWNRFGRRFYPGRCPFNRVYGGFFYC